MCSPAGFPATATVTGIVGVAGTLGAVVTGRTGATAGAAGTASGAGTTDQRKLLQGPDVVMVFGPCFAVLMTPEQLQELINALELKEHDFLIEAVLVARQNLDKLARRHAPRYTTVRYCTTPLRDVL